MKKTKIISTIGPSSIDLSVMEELILKGTDVIRINLSHADEKFCDEVITKVRKLEKKLQKPIGIMLDTDGPSVRLDKFKEEKAFLSIDHEVKLYRYHVLCNNIQFSINDPEVIDDLIIGDVLLLSDGNVLLEVMDILNDYVSLKVIKEGYIYSNQTVHLKGKSFDLPFLSEKDRKGILYGIKKKVDFIALSYVRSEIDVLEVVDLIIENGDSHIGIISKIENNDAINNLEEIVDVSDGVMVARGDLAIEMSIEKMPYFQKEILEMARKHEKIGVVATDFLLSMAENNTPARAEVSDIYNAIMDKCDAILLSGETTIGKYPVLAVETLSKVIVSAEEDFDYDSNLNNILRDKKQDITSSIAYSVVDSSIRLNTKYIVANTNSGYTALKISHFRPRNNILGFSPSNDTIHALTLVYGVIPIKTIRCTSTDKIIDNCLSISKKMFKLKKNDIIIITGGFPVRSKNTNFMKVEII